MPHQLIIGMTLSGKTTLAKLMIAELKKNGHKTAVLDPLGDPTFNADFQTKDSNEFLKFAKREKDFFIFVDEGGSSIGRYNSEMDWLVTTGRHNGHYSTLISHGATQLNNIVRGQCENCFLFSCAQANIDIVAEEWNEPMLKNIGRIPQYEFFLVSRFGQLKKGKILLDKGQVSYTIYKESSDSTEQPDEVIG